MSIYMTGIDHNTAQIDVRTVFSFTKTRLFLLNAFQRQIFYYLSRNDQTDYRWNKSVAARNLAALCTLPCDSGQADAMRAAADRHIVNRRQRRLFGINNFSFSDPAASEFVPHDFGKRANGSAVNIRHFKDCRRIITLTSGLISRILSAATSTLYCPTVFLLA